jgi:hypothetical protein
VLGTVTNVVKKELRGLASTERLSGATTDSSSWDFAKWHRELLAFAPVFYGRNKMRDEIKCKQPKHALRSWSSNASSR